MIWLFRGGRESLMMAVWRLETEFVAGMKAPPVDLIS